MSRSCVVYKYVCPQCGAVYVGSTTRTLHTRVSEHRGVSPRTEMFLSQPPHSSIRDHSEQTCQCAPKQSSFSIIDCDSNQLSLRIRESIHIHSTKPSLNETVSSYPLHILHWSMYSCSPPSYVLLLFVFQLPFYFKFFLIIHVFILFQIILDWWWYEYVSKRFYFTFTSF